MDEGAVFIAVLVLWLAPFVAAWMIGADKGRGFQGFTFGLLFGVFGLIAISAMEPSDAILARRQAALADLVAARISGGGDLGDTRVCPACFGTIPRAASACMHCGRDVPPPAAEAAGSADNTAIGVVLNHLDSASTGPMMMFLEPSWVTLSACDDDCDTVDHELALSVDECRQFLDAFRVTTQENRPSCVRLADGEITFAWVDGEDEDNTRELVVDWSTQFAGPYTSDADTDREHGLIVLTGEIANRSSPIGALDSALATGARMSALWAEGQANPSDVRAALATVGSVT